MFIQLQDKKRGLFSGTVTRLVIPDHYIIVGVSFLDI